MFEIVYLTGFIACTILVIILLESDNHAIRRKLKPWRIPESFIKEMKEQDSLWTKFKARSIGDIYVSSVISKQCLDNNIRVQLYRYEINIEDVNISYEEHNSGIIAHITYKNK